MHHQAAGLYDFGDDTGCSSSAPTVRDVFGEMSAWLNRQENKKELLFIKMETYVGDNVSAGVVLIQLSQALERRLLQPFPM